MMSLESWDISWIIIIIKAELTSAADRPEVASCYITEMTCLGKLFLNAIDPAQDYVVPNAHETEDYNRAVSPPSRLGSPNIIEAPQHRDYPNRSPSSLDGTGGEDSGIPSESDASSVSGATRSASRSSTPSIGHAASDYGTFTQQSQRKIRKPKVYRVTFEVSNEYADHSSTLRDSSAPVLKDSKTYETECLLSKEEVDHMCDDTSERDRTSPDSAHWRQVLVASVLLCPVCGIASAIYAYRSKRHHDLGKMESAKRMLRHSDFWLRLATVFGIIVWFLCFLFLVVNKDKLKS
ncbi:hypothetical protein PoB_005059700 [Plakobranchus ocellatus]|uniref:Uncharacterized protein n=1 Tax=Plakobranchus ocellatus TaxID=259542 RepID=A0AAV4BYG8_9GAST|nr:hypothetical protein PoB_005059700 [Plakobranchus ocellatus]